MHQCTNRLLLTLDLNLNYPVLLFMCSGVVLGISANFAKIFLPNIHRMLIFHIYRLSAYVLLPRRLYDHGHGRFCFHDFHSFITVCDVHFIFDTGLNWLEQHTVVPAQHWGPHCARTVNFVVGWAKLLRLSKKSNSDDPHSSRFVCLVSALVM